MSAAWDNFVASLNIEELRREQAPVGGDLDAERFGSRQHHEMVHAHEYIAADFWRRVRGEETEYERAARKRRWRDRDERIAAAARAAHEERQRDALLLALDDEHIDTLVHEHRRDFRRTSA